MLAVLPGEATIGDGEETFYAIYRKRRSEVAPTSSGVGTGHDCAACFSASGVARSGEAGVVQPQLSGEEQESQPQFQ